MSDRYTLAKHRNGSYDILLDGKVQITGAIFSNKNGDDNKKVMARAVKALNKALAQGQHKVTLKTPMGRYPTHEWDLLWHNHDRPIEGLCETDTGPNSKT